MSESTKANSRSPIDQAKLFYDEGRLLEAEDACRRIVAGDPRQVEALCLLGLLATRRGDHGSALELLQGAVALAPEKAQAHNNLGMAQANAGRMDDAIACYRKATGINPGFAEAYNNLGNLLRYLGRYEEAAENYRLVSKLDPGKAAPHNNLGMALRGLGDLDGAHSCFRRAIELTPDFAAAHNNLGLTRMGRKEYGKAVESFERAVALTPLSAEYQNNLGTALDALGRSDDARKCYQQALEVDPRFASAYGNLGNVLKNQGNLDEAITCYRRAIKINPEIAEAHNNLGIALKEQGMLEASISAYRRAIEVRPRYAEAWNNLGNAYKDEEKNEEALEAFARAIEIDPDFIEPHFNRASIMTFHRGDPRLRKLEELASRDDLDHEQESRVLFALGRAHDSIGNYQKAFGYFERANDDMADRVNYDLEQQEIGITETKRQFPVRDPAGRAAIDPNARTPIFIVGMSRSSKTLAQSLLALHPEVHGADETHAWTDAMKEVLGRHGVTRPFPLCMEGLPDSVVREMGRAYLEELAVLAPDHRFVVNTMPSNYPYLGLIMRALPTARMIYCHRHPLDNCLFMYFYRYRDSNGYSYDLGRLATYCANYYDMMAHWRRLYGDEILSVRYEDLVATPAVMIARIYSHCGLDPDVATTPESYDTGEIGHWKHYERQLEPVRAVLGDLISQEWGGE